MILSLFVVLVGISLVLIIIGLVRPTESAQALVGFFFLFLLALIIVGGSLQYETGINTTSTYGYNVNGTLVSTDQSVMYNYANFDDTTSHRIGYYLALASAVGFIGVFCSVAKTKWGEKEE